MTGYALFRGDTLVEHNFGFGGVESAGKLHDLGQEGDVLVYLGIKHIGTYLWATPIEEGAPYWIPFSDPDSKRYRVLALIQS